MFTKFKNSFQTKGILKVIFVLPVLTAVIYPNFSSPTKAGLEFQWGDNPNYKKLDIYFTGIKRGHRPKQKGGGRQEPFNPFTMGRR